MTNQQKAKNCKCKCICNCECEENINIVCYTNIEDNDNTITCLSTLSIMCNTTTICNGNNSSDDNEVSYNNIDNDIKNAIKYNKQISDKLHMIICISNPCQYMRRYRLAQDFKERMEKENDVILYIVELVYDLPGKIPQKHYITDSDNPRHLQLSTKTSPLWHKENMWNLGVALLPSDWKCVAFCDADISFENPHFAQDTLKVLNGTRDIVQMYSHCLDLNANLDAMSIFSSFGYQFSNNRKYTRTGLNFWHPGYNVAMTREAYEQINGLYMHSILGSGDHNLFLCLLGNGTSSIMSNVSEGYKRSILCYQDKCKGLRIGYVNGIIKHYFHGTKKNRQYSERWKILVKHQYDPYKHIETDCQGLLVPSKECPSELLDDIMLYFESRNEDELI